MRYFSVGVSKICFIIRHLAKGRLASSNILISLPRLKTRDVSRDDSDVYSPVHSALVDMILTSSDIRYTQVELSATSFNNTVIHSTSTGLNSSSQIPGLDLQIKYHNSWNILPFWSSSSSNECVSQFVRNTLRNSCRETHTGQRGGMKFKVEETVKVCVGLWPLSPPLHPQITRSVFPAPVHLWTYKLLICLLYGSHTPHTHTHTLRAKISGMVEKPVDFYLLQLNWTIYKYHINTAEVKYA